MGLIYEWIRNIVIYMILNTLILNVFGDSNYKKYIQLVTGMILVVIVISPVIKFLRVSDRVEDLFHAQVYAVDVSDFKSQLKTMEEGQTDFVYREYKERIVSQVEDMISDYDLCVKESDIIFETDENCDEFGEIKSMAFVLSPKEEKKEATRERISIKKVMLSKKEQETSVNIPSPTEINIKNELSDFYNIEGDNINISIQGGSHE